MDKSEKERKFETWAREHRSTIYTVCYMFSKDEDEVADLFQEVLINLWQGMDSFGGRSSVKTWIYRVALNTCISIDRKRRRQETVPLTMDINLFCDQDEDTRQVSQLHRRIQQLPPVDRALILLWLEGISYDEMGLICGLTAKNVSVRLVRIKERLKRIRD